MNELVPVGKNELATIEEANSDIVIHKKPSNGNIILQTESSRQIINVKNKSIYIGGKKFDVDPRQLIRMIKQITQTIGEYKEVDNPYASYVIGSLRKARADMVSDLEHHFKIHWEIADDGASRFWVYDRKIL